MLDREEYRRWMSQAEHTFASAARDLEAGDHGWACFKSEQAAQLAVKAFLRALGEVAFGHSLTRLVSRLDELGVGVPEEIRRSGRRLESHYVPSRYPDVYPAGSPFEFYDEGRAREALAQARGSLDFVSERFRDAERARSEESEEG